MPVLDDFSSAVSPAVFSRDGFVVLPGFLDEAELPPVRAEVAALLSEPLPPGCTRPHNTLAPLCFSDPLVELVLSSEQRMRALAAAITAEDLRWISGYISTKDPRTDALWWHQDWWCWDHPVTYQPAATQVAVLCYLTDTDATNGALRILPGSHHRSMPLHSTLPEAHAQEDGIDPQDPAMSDHPEQVTFQAIAGDAVILDYRLLHGTHPNLSEERRDCLLLTFAPSWQSLPTDIRAHLIRHPAQPTDPERPPTSSWQSRLLPTFHGPPRDLPLNRVAPEEFAVGSGRVTTPHGVGQA